MKFRDPETGEFKELYTKAADTLPVGTVVDFDGTEIPAGWEEAEHKVSYGKMTAELTSEQTCATGVSTTLNLTSQVSRGDGLTLSNGAIVCKTAGVVEVSGHFRIGNLVVGGNTIPRIVKNNVAIISNETRTSNEGIQGFGIPTKLVSVVAGDTIKLVVGNWSGKDNTAQPGSYLTVAYVE